jgi:hypothetical protein
MRNLGISIFICFTSVMALGQVNWYIAPNGANTPTSGTSPASPFATFDYATNYLTPGDTLFALGGTYQNTDYNDSDIWTGSTAARIEAHGTATAYITFKPYQNQKPIINFDGNYGILIQNSSYLKLIGFEVRGIGWDIDLAEAYEAWGLYKTSGGVLMDLAIQMGINPSDPLLLNQELPKPSTPGITKPVHFNGRGIVANSSHHIEIIGNKVHDVPASAIRVQQSDWVTVSDNEVFDNTFWTTLGVGAITVAEATNSDNSTDIKIRIQNNHVHHNENRIISWAPDKSFVKFVIDEGSGIFMTRNASTYLSGKIGIFNNISHHNGASGITCHFTDRAVIEHNTVYLNGQNNTGTAGGISLNTADTVIIRNNISYAKPNKHALGWLSQPGTGLTTAANLVFNENGISVTNNITSGWTMANPLFMHVTNNNFCLKNGSPALAIASANLAPTTDYYGVSRPVNHDLGAIEHHIGQCVPCVKVAAKVFLQAAYNNTSGMMTDNLRSAGLLPTLEPYASLGFGHISNSSGDESVQASVFTTTGANAIVDWVFIELRDKNAPGSKLFTRSALLQRDGDIVDMDGVSPVFFPTATEQDYYLAVRHRNHLGVRSLTVSTLTQHAPLVNLTNNLATLYKPAGHPNEVATSFPNGKIGLWAGNANGDNSVKMTGAFPSSNDYLKLLNTLGSSTVVLSNIYSQQDLNMDGSVKMTGAFPNTNDYLRLLNVLNSSTNTLQQGF